MHKSVRKVRCVVLPVVVLLLLCGSHLHSASAVGGQQPQCQPDKINQLLKEIMNCQRQKPPTAPGTNSGEPESAQPPFSQPGPEIPSGSGRPMSPRGWGGLTPRLPPRGYPGAPSANDFNFPNKGTFFISGSPSGQGGGADGVLVSSPVPADVQPVQNEGIPSDSQFFIASPRMRPNQNSGPTFGSGFPFILSSRGGGAPGYPKNPQENPNPSGSGGERDNPGSQPAPDSIFSTFSGSFPFGGPPSFDFNTFGSSPFPNGPPSGPSFGFGIPPSASGPPPNSFDIDFDEIIKILKGLQSPDDKSDSDDKPVDPDMNSNTTEGIIEVDTTMDPSETTATPDSTEQPMPTTTMTKPSEKP